MKKIFTSLLLLSTLGLSENIKFESAYTDIDTTENCRLIKAYDMGESLDCGMYAGMAIVVSSDDLRDTITLIRDDTPYNLDFSTAITSHFSQLGKKIEWRYPKGEATYPTAMIARLNITLEGEKQNDRRVDSYLIVSKITKEKICAVEKVAPQKNQNILAREIADKASTLICLVDKEINERI